MHVNDLTQFSTSNAGSDSVASAIDVKHYLYLLWQRKWFILLAVVVFGAWGYVNSLSAQPFYTATMTLLLEEESQPIVRLEDLYTGNRRGFEYMQTQYGILQSRRIAEKVVRRAQLHKHPAITEPEPETGLLSFLAEPPKPEPINIPEEAQIKALIGLVAGGVGISGDDSRILTLSFTSHDPDLSVVVVNTLADVYIEDTMNAEVEASQQATLWLTERLESLYSNLKLSEDKLQAFREQEQLIDIEGGVATIGTREFEDLTLRYNEARTKRSNLENTYQRIQASPRSQLISISAISSHSSVTDINANLLNLQKRQAELAKRYGPKHPKMIALQAEIDSSQSILANEVRNVANTIKLEYEAALKNERTSQALLSRAKGNLQDLNRKEFKLQELQREVDTNLQLYELFFQRVKETTDASGFVKPHARVLDRAEWASASSINRIRGIVIAIIFGLVLSVAIIIALDFLDDKIKSPFDAQERLHLPFLGIIPLVRDAKGRIVSQEEFPFYWTNTQSSFAESIRTIRTGVVLESLDSPAKTIVITSTLPAEGKSTVALNFASALGQMENVLLIGADLRRPTLVKKLGLDSTQLGLSDYLTGVAKANECLIKVPEANIYLMPAGSIPSHPLEMLSSPQFKQLVTRFSAKFDRIVIDSAPTHAVSDALVLASMADTVMYVVKANETPAKLIKQGLRRLREATDVSVGIVLNDFDESKVAAHSGAGYYNNAYYSMLQSTGAFRRNS